MSQAIIAMNDCASNGNGNGGSNGNGNGNGNGNDNGKSPACSTTTTEGLDRADIQPETAAVSGRNRCCSPRVAGAAAAPAYDCPVHFHDELDEAVELEIIHSLDAHGAGTRRYEGLITRDSPCNVDVDVDDALGPSLFQACFCLPVSIDNKGLLGTPTERWVPTALTYDEHLAHLKHLPPAPSAKKRYIQRTREQASSNAGIII